MRLQATDITSFPEYNGVREIPMATKLTSSPKPLSTKLIAVWLKLDPLVHIIAKDNQRIRHDAMLALAGKKAAKHYFGKFAQLKPPPQLISPSDVRKKELEFLDQPDARTKIIRQLVYWGRDKYLNSENPDSHKTRMQITQSLLGAIFINANETQEKLIVDGVKVLVVSRETSLGNKGEQSPIVHQSIIQKIVDLLRYNHLVIKGKQDEKSQAAMRVNLIKTIQGLKQGSNLSAYWVADDQAKRKKIISQKFPLKHNTEQGLIAIIKHYTFSANSQFKDTAVKTLEEIYPELD